MRSARTPALILLIPLLLLVLASCGGGAGRSPSSTDQSVEPSAPKAASGAPAGRAEGSRNSGVAPERPAAADAAGGSGAGAEAGQPAPAPTPAASGPDAANQLPALDQKIIRTGTIDLIVTDVAAALRSITDMVRGANGYVQQSATRDQGGVTVAEVVVRVPVDQYDGVFQKLRDLAAPDKEPVENSTSQDVTEEFVDTEARIRNLKATEQQIIQLLSKAEKIEDILIIQRELTEVRGQIERLQGRLNVLERQAAYSTITVSLRPVPEAGKPSLPRLLEPAANARNIDPRPTFVWSTVEGATAYSLQVTTEVDTTFATPIINAERLNATSFEWPAGQAELRAGETYRWRVRAHTDAADGDWSSARIFYTIPAWNPLNTVAEAWQASLLFLQRFIDGLLTFVVFFWWLILLLAVAIALLRGRIGRAFTGRRTEPLPPPAPPAGPPAA
jgi:hypothetical protein